MRVDFAVSDPTPFYPERLACGYFAALAAAAGVDAPDELPPPRLRSGKPEPHADAPPWERHSWKASGLDVTVKVVPRVSGHGVHGSEMRWTSRHAASDLVLAGRSFADARSSDRFAELDLAPLGHPVRRAVERAFRAALGDAGGNISERC